MELGEIFVVLVGVAAIGFGIWQVRKDGRVLYKPSEALEVFYDVMRLVETYAPAADQLFKIGQLDKEDRLEYVIDMVFEYVDYADISGEQVRGIVEGWVAQQKQAE